MTQRKSTLSRRALFAGAGTAGAVAAAATLLPGVVQQVEPGTQATKEPPARGGGYHLTEHVKRYYQTTLI